MLSPANEASKHAKSGRALLSDLLKTRGAPSVTDNFWDRVAGADLKLTEHYLEGELSDESTAGLIRIYQDASNVAQDRGAMRSVTDNIGFMIQILKTTQTSSKPRARRATKLEPLIKALSDLYQVLGGEAP